MATDSRSVRFDVPRSIRRQALPGAVGMHLGLLIVCASAVYTGWQRTIVTLPQWAAMLVVAAALVVGAFTSGAQGVRRRWVRLTLALAGLMAFKLCYDPQLGALPRLGERLPQTFLDTYPSVALIGIAILFISWLAYRGAEGEHGMGTIPLRNSIFGAVGLTVASAAVAYLLLHPAHELPFSATLRVMLAVVQAGCLAGVLTGIGGGGAVGRAPHLLLALTLVLAFARNMAYPME